MAGHGFVSKWQWKVQKVKINSLFGGMSEFDFSYLE
jgi:hypothetical protein